MEAVLLGGGVPNFILLKDLLLRALAFIRVFSVFFYTKMKGSQMYQLVNFSDVFVL